MLPTTTRLPSLLIPPNRRKRSRNKSSPTTTTPRPTPTTANANVPNTRDLFKLAHNAWRGVEVKHYDPQHGSDLIKGRDLVQWLLYQCQYPDTPEYREYVIRIAQVFLDKRYLVRITSPPRILGWVRKRRVNTTFSDDKYLYDFNDVAVSNIHVVVLVECATNLMGKSCTSPAVLVPVLYQSCTSHSPVIHQSFTSHSPVIHQSFTSPVPLLYHSCTTPVPVLLSLYPSCHTGYTNSTLLFFQAATKMGSPIRCVKCPWEDDKRQRLESSCLKHHLCGTKSLRLVFGIFYRNN
jgi:hypothetical protein